MSSLKKIVLIILLLSLSLSSFAKQPPAISTSGSKLNVIFLVDNSGSMGNKYNQVKQALTKLITNKSLASQANFSLLTWGSNTCTIYSNGNYYCPRSTYRTPVYATRQYCYTYYQWRYVYGYGWRYEPYRSCYSYRYVSHYTYTDRYLYYFVPLNQDKVANYNEMMKGIAEVDAEGGGTQVGNPMNAIKTYINSAEYKKNINAECDRTIIIVMSDGYWSQGSIAEQRARELYQTHNIPTFVVAFGINSNSLMVNLASAGQTYPKPGVLGGTSIDPNDLANSFMEAIQSVNFDAYSTVAPTVLPEMNAGNLILNAEFKYSAQHQWEGYLKAKKINDDGSIGGQIWELGENLNRTHPDSRRIWTAAAGLATPTQSNRMYLPNNLLWNDSSYVTKYAQLMETGGYFSNSSYYDAYYLLRFIRGYDSYNENSGSSYRWKLNDIYNSKPKYVGQPPDIPKDSKYAGEKKYFYDLDPNAYDQFQKTKRTPMVYVGSNAGLVHAVDANTGQEKWAFMPPPMLNKMKEVISSARGNTNSIYGVDGPLVVDDIYIDGKWRTYMIISFGYGARAFSVIDVTTPEYPAHVFSIENYIDDNGTLKVKKWDSAGNEINMTSHNASSTAGCFGCYKQLGYTTSAPHFTYAWDAHSRSSYSPIMIIGGGSTNSGLGNINQTTGNTVYVVTLKASALGEVMTMKNIDAPDSPAGATITKCTTGSSGGGSVGTTFGYFNDTSGIQVGSYITGPNMPSNTYVTRIYNGFHPFSGVQNSGRVYFSQNVGVYKSVSGCYKFTVPKSSEVKTDVAVLSSGSTKEMEGTFGYRMVIPNNNGIISSTSDTSKSIYSIPDSRPQRVINNVGSMASAYSTYYTQISQNNDQVIQRPISITRDVADSKDELNIIYGTGDMEDVSTTNKVIKNVMVSIQNTESCFFATESSKTRCRGYFWNVFKAESYNSKQGWLTTLNIDPIFFNASEKYPPACNTDRHEGWFIDINNVYAYDENNQRKGCVHGKVSTAIHSYGGITSAGIYIPQQQGATGGANKTCGSGSSAVIFRSTSCGTEMYKGIYLKNILVGGITSFNDNIYISISGEKGSSNLDSKGNFKKTDNLITGKPGYKLDDSSSSAVNVEVKSHMRIQ